MFAPYSRAMRAADPLSPPHWPWLAAAVLAVLPFLFVTVPPLADAPGHLGRLAVQAAAPDSPLRRYFAFHWGLRLNLGSDILVELLRRPLGLVPAFRLVAALIPLLTVAAIWALARCGNPGRAAAAAWALPFAYAYPFNYGFLNYALGMALSLLAFALWIALDGRGRLRTLLFWAIVPALLIVHAIGGGLLPVMILARTIGRGTPRHRDMAMELSPLLGGAVLILLWRAGAPAGAGSIAFDLAAKLNALPLALRDQSRPLDIASIAAILAVPVIGRLLGARYNPANRAVVIALAILFVAMPNEATGASFTDTRLIVPLLIAALALQDWAGVDRRAATAVMLAGFALFALRMEATIRGFVAYERSYTAEHAALPHIAIGSRVLALVGHPCRASRGWRTDRLDHLADLATVERAAWVNAHWDVAGVHLLDIRYRPSPFFYDDPSQYVWPKDCVEGQPAPTTTAARHDIRRTIEQAVPLLPLDRVDYLWLINARLPPGPWAARLTPLWSNGASSLYATH